MAGSRTYLPASLTSLVFALSLIGFVICGNPIFDNPDTAWHLAAGDLIRATGAIPSVDPWSYSAEQTPWYNISWAWDVLISAVTTHFGLDGLYLFKSLWGALVVAALCSSLKARGTISDGFNLLMLLLVWYVLLAYLHPQPIMATLLFTIWTHRLLHESRTDDRKLIWIPLLMVLWVNMHAGFVVGLSLVAIFALEAQQTGQMQWLKRLVVCGVVCVLACLVNPYHIHAFTSFVDAMHSAITPYLADWHPLTIGNETNFTIFLLLFIFVTNLREPRVPLADRILAVAWLIYALHTRRNFAIFALVAAPYFAFCLQDFAQHAQGKSRALGNLIADSLANRKRAAVAVLLTLLILAMRPVLSLLAAPEKFSDDPYKIHPAMEFVKTHAPKARFLNDYNIGGYLIYLSDGQWQMFVDGRAGTAYPEEVLKDVITFGTLAEGYQEVLKKYQVDGVIVTNDHPFAAAFHDAKNAAWREAYRNEKVSVFLSK